MTDVVITGTAALRPGTVPAAGPAGTPPAHRVAEFDPAEVFGRKATRFHHRSTLLMMAAADSVLREHELDTAAEDGTAVGITVGTTMGSLSGIHRLGADTFGTDRPYLVAGAEVPNLALNTAAGALAIQTGARGANTTVVGGPLAGVSALRHAEVILRARHVGTVIVGASEEATEAAQWWAASALPTERHGEGAAAVIVERAEAAEAASRTPLARLGAAVLRAVDVNDSAALAKLVDTALRRASTDPGQVVLAALRESGVPAVDVAQDQALRMLPRAAVRRHEKLIGDCYSAHGLLQLVDLIDELTRTHTGTQAAAVVLAVDPDGAAGVVVVSLADDPSSPPSPK